MAKGNDEKELRALTVALEMLRKGVADLPLVNLTTAIEHWDETQQRTVLQTKGGVDWEEMSRRAELQAVRAAKKRASEDKELSDSKKPINFAEEFRKQTLSAIREAKQRKAEDAEIADSQRGFFGRAAKGASENIGGGLSNFMNSFLGKFTAVIGPLAILGQVLQSSASGFQLLSSGVKLLAAVFAPFLLPIFVMFGGLLFAVAQMLDGKLQPALVRWMTFVVEDVVPVMEDFARGLEVLVEGARDVAGAFQEAIDYIDEAIFGTSNAVKLAAGAGDTGAGDYSGGWGAGAGGSFDDGPGYGGPGDGSGGAARGGAGGAGGGKGGVAGGMEIMLQELRRSLGPQASFSGLAAASRSAQLAALNGSPIDKMLLDKTIRVVELLEGIWRNTGKTTPAVGH